MWLFLDAVPFLDSPLEVEAPWSPGRAQLKPFQVVIWVSLTHPEAETLPPDSPRLPALLDTGHNHHLSLRVDHLLASGLSAPVSWSDRPLRVRDAGGQDRDVPRLLVDVWIHSNRSELAEQPYRLRLGFGGAACYPASGPFQGPPLPLLGLAALCAGSLQVELQCCPTGGTLRVFVPDLPQPIDGKQP